MEPWFEKNSNHMVGNCCVKLKYMLGKFTSVKNATLVIYDLDEWNNSKILFIIVGDFLKNIMYKSSILPEERQKG